MKKEILKHNVIFYGIQYSLSLLYVGFELGEINWERWMADFNIKYDSWYIRCILQYLAIPTIFFILMLIGRRIYREREYCTGKSYYTMAAVTLAYSALLWAELHYLYNDRFMTFTSRLDYVIYPAVMAFFSVVIAAFYIACAVKTAKENKKYKQNLNADRT